MWRLRVPGSQISAAGLWPLSVTASARTLPSSIHATRCSFPDELKGSEGFKAICCHCRPHPASPALLCHPPRPCCVGTAQGALERPVHTLLAARRAANTDSAASLHSHLFLCYGQLCVLFFCPSLQTSGNYDQLTRYIYKIGNLRCLSVCLFAGCVSISYLS